MAALLRGVARSFALVAAARSGALDFSTRGGGGGVTGRTRIVMASLPGFCGTGFSRPVLSLTPASAHQLSSSSSSFLAYQRLSMRPQVKAIGNGSKQINAFQLKSQEGQAISVRDFEDVAPSTQPRESWAPSRIPDDRSSYSGNGMGRNYNSRPKSMSVGNIAPRTRFVKTTPSSDVFQDSQAFRRNPSPFRQKEYSSSAVLEGFDDNEGEMDVETYKRTHDISTSGTDVPDPYMTFASTGFPPTLMRELESAGFSSPSAIQAMTWPIAGAGRDVVAIAKTGSGKTLGYLVPAFLRLEKERSGYRRDPTVLVLAPTRELANQIRDEAWKFGRSSRVAVTCVCGGTPKGPQLRDIDRGVDVIVATPGRLNDLLEMRAVNLQKVTYLVLDEADRMLDMGFEPQIRAIVDQMSPKRQTLMYTATWPHEVRRIARDLMTNPVQVNIGNSDVLSANKNITQIVEVVSRFEKDKRLDEILANVEEGSKVLIFCTTKRMCDDLAMNMRNKYGALAIHGDKSQRERDYVMQQFKRGRTPVLVATDVAARGLDIKDIKMVLNYDFPTCVEDYVHRIGRTGRAGATGMAHTFFGYEDAKHAGDLIKVLESTGQQVLPDLRQMGARNGNSRGGNSRYGGYGGRGGGGGFRSQPSYYTGKSDAFGSGFRYGQSDRMGGDRYGGYGGDRFGSDNKFGGDRFGGDNRFGGDRFGGDKKFGGDRFGGESKFGSDRFGGSNSFGGDNRFGSDRVGSESKFGSDRFGSDGKFESDRFVSDRVGVDKFGSGRFGGVKTSSDFTGSNPGEGDSVGDESTSTKPKTLLDFDFSSEKYTKKPPRPMRAGRRFNQMPMQSTTTLPSFDGYATANDKSTLTPNYGELKMNPDGTMSLW